MRMDDSRVTWDRFLKSRPRAGLEVLPFFDVLLIVCFISLNFSKFVLTPGMEVELPGSVGFLGTKVAPTAVLTIDRNELYFFEGKILTKDTLGDGFAFFFREQFNENFAEKKILLIKAHRELPTEVLVHTMDVAESAGFDAIHIAVETLSSAEQRLL